MEEEIEYLIACADDQKSYHLDSRECLYELSKSNTEMKIEEIAASEILPGPISLVVVADAEQKHTSTTIPEDRLAGRKPLFIRANISKCHIKDSEDPAEFHDLRNIITTRGITAGDESDDCGHIISPNFNGCMVDYNLFPQSKNKCFGNYVLQKVLELSMQIWLKLLHEDLNPRVEYSVLLSYGDKNFPDRPDGFKHEARFLVERQTDVPHKDEHRKMMDAFKEILNICKLLIKNTGNDDVFRKSISQILQKFNVNENIRVEIDLLVEALEVILPKVVPTATVRVRGTSILDFIPVVASLKTMKEGMEDMSDGSYLKGAANLAIGGGCLAMDVSSLGAVVSITRGATTPAVKFVARHIATFSVRRVLRF